MLRTRTLRRVVALLSAIGLAGTTGAIPAAATTEEYFAVTNSYVRASTSIEWGVYTLRFSISITDKGCNATGVVARLHVYTYSADPEYYTPVLRNEEGCNWTVHHTGQQTSHDMGIRGVKLRACEAGGIHCIEGLFHPNQALD